MLGFCSRLGVHLDLLGLWCRLRIRLLLGLRLGLLGLRFRLGLGLFRFGFRLRWFGFWLLGLGLLLGLCFWFRLRLRLGFRFGLWFRLLHCLRVERNVSSGIRYLLRIEGHKLPQRLFQFRLSCRAWLRLRFRFCLFFLHKALNRLREAHRYGHRLHFALDVLQRHGLEGKSVRENVQVLLRDKEKVILFCGSESPQARQENDFSLLQHLLHFAEELGDICFGSFYGDLVGFRIELYKQLILKPSLNERQAPVRRIYGISLI